MQKDKYPDSVPDKEPLREAPTVLTRGDDDPVPHLRAFLTIDHGKVTLDRVIGIERSVHKSDVVVGSWIFDIHAGGERIALTSMPNPFVYRATGKPLAPDHHYFEKKKGQVKVDIPMIAELAPADITVRVVRLAEPIRSKAELAKRLDARKLDKSALTMIGEVKLGECSPDKKPPRDEKEQAR